MSPWIGVDEYGFYSSNGTMSVSVFSEFTDLCARFLWACQYDGHLEHHLHDRVTAAGETDKAAARRMTRALGFRLLEELRRMLWDPENNRTTVTDLMRQLVDGALREGLTGRVGRQIVPAACPWCIGTQSGPDLSELRTDERKRFGDGELAREALVQMVDIAAIATHQAHEYARVQRLSWSEKQTQQRVEDVLAHPHFETGCYSDATGKSLGRWPRVLRERNPDASQITLDSIRRLVAHPIKRPESPMTYFGRFGSIVRDCLQAMTKESTGKSHLVQEAEAPAKRTSPLANRIESLLEEYPGRHRRILGSFISLYKNGVKKKEAVRDVARDYRITQSFVRGLVKDFCDRL